MNNWNGVASKLSRIINDKKAKNGCLFSIDEKTRNEKLEMRKQKKQKKKKNSFLYRQCPIISNFLNQRRKIFWPQRLRPQNKIRTRKVSLNLLRNSYLKFDPTFVDEWHSEISTSLSRKKEKGGRTTGLADERTERHNFVRWQDHTWGEEGVTSSWIRPHSHERTREPPGLRRNTTGKIHFTFFNGKRHFKNSN